MSETHAMTPPAADAASGVTPQDSPRVEQERRADSPASVQDVEQGDQTKRINGLMGLAAKRTAERDAAFAEIEELKSRLNALAEQNAQDAASTRPSQHELLYPEQYDQPTDDQVTDAAGDYEPPPVVIDPNAAPRHAPRPVSPPTTTNPSAYWLQSQREVEQMKRELARLSKAASSSPFFD